MTDVALRILIGVTHLFGVGHLARAAAIARALAQAGHGVTLVSGGNPAPFIRTAGAKFIQLPPLHIEGTSFARLLDQDGGDAPRDLLRRRRDELLSTLAHTRPDVLITELFPFGRRALADEFTALVEGAVRQRPRPAVLCSVRDILVSPTQQSRIREAHERLASLYDGILVHGDPTVVRLEESWPTDPSVMRMIQYTGYIDDVLAESGSTSLANTGEGEIVVSAGGSDAGRGLYMAAAACAAGMPETRWRLLAGGLRAADFDRLKATAASNVAVERARADFPALLARCTLSISQAGYNTVLDLARAGVRSIVVPFTEGGETEQATRAARFEALGVLKVLPAERLGPESLAAAVRAAMALPRRPAAAFRRDGLSETVRIVEQAATTAQRRSTPVVKSAGWQGLERQLTRLSHEGHRIEFWWRDDDAVAPSRALDRLLAIRRRLALPLAIATVPESATAVLGRRLDEETLTSVLVHGLAHRNHAPEGEKKAEFGGHRPITVLVADAAEALSLAARGFPRALVPVFVPPWNRIAPQLVPHLRALGYRGLSTYGNRERREPVPGLVQVNCLIDPVDWRHGLGLRDEGDIIATVMLAIEKRTSSPEDDLEPLGLLTHHLAQDENTWTFCERLLETFARHGAMRPVAAEMLFGETLGGRNHKMSAERPLSR